MKLVEVSLDQVRKEIKSKKEQAAKKLTVADIELIRSNFIPATLYDMEHDKTYEDSNHITLYSFQYLDASLEIQKLVKRLVKLELAYRDNQGSYTIIDFNLIERSVK